MLGNAVSAAKVLLNLRHLLLSQRSRRSEASKATLDLLTEGVTDAIQSVPYYRRLAEQFNLGSEELQSESDFLRFPITTKDDVKSNFPDQLVRNGFEWETLYSVSTSGTTDRIMIFQDEERRNWDRAADLLLAWEGNGFRPGDRSITFPPDACYEHCGADGRMRTYSIRERFQQWRKAPPERRRQAARDLRSKIMSEFVWRSRQLPSLGVDGTAAPDEVLESYCEELESWRPQVVNGLPVTLYVLALYALRAGREFPSVQIVRPNGGKFSEVMLETVEQAFGARVRENYGSAELSTIAFDCECCREQHLLGEIFYLECLRDGEPVSPGEIGSLVITDMRNRVTPLIRYTIGDVGRISDGPCACGFEGTRFVVDGRMEETVVTPGGRPIAGTQIVDLFLRRPEIDHVKILQQDDDHFLVEVVPSPGNEKALDSESLGEALSDLLQHPVTVKARAVRRIAPERNGKYRLVTSQSYPHLHGPS